MISSVLLFGGIVLLIAASAFFSGSETGLYRLSRFRLRLGVEHRKPFYATLFKLVRDGRSLMISILIGNNLINYLLTSLVMVLMIEHISDQRLAELYTTALLTPVLFVFGEMIPKILFSSRRQPDPAIDAAAVAGSQGVFANRGGGALRWLSDGLSRLFRLAGDAAAAVDATQRHQVFQIIHETREEGLLSRTQREMIERLLQIPNVPIHTVMTPFEQVEKVSVPMSRRDLLDHLIHTSFVRQPVCGTDESVIGYIPIYEVLGGEDDFSDLRAFVQPLVQLEATCSAIDAMNILCRKREKIALVQSPQTGQPLGIVTLTDLVEELTGELAV